MNIIRWKKRIWWSLSCWKSTDPRLIFEEGTNQSQKNFYRFTLKETKQSEISSHTSLFQFLWLRFCGATKITEHWNLKPDFTNISPTLCLPLNRQPKLIVTSNLFHSTVISYCVFHTINSENNQSSLFHAWHHSHFPQWQDIITLSSPVPGLGWAGLRSQCPLMGLASPECPDLGLIAQPRPESQLSESEYHRGLSQI